MSLLLFWSAVALIIYTYGLFPALVFARARLRRRPYQKTAVTPRVSLIIAAHNEAESIGVKLENLLALDYPRDCLEVIIASDGSTDATEMIVRRYADQGIQLLALPRQGKAHALNAAAAAAKNEILVFSDANSMYAPDAIRALVQPFADPAVGGVAGNQCYVGKQSVSLASGGERSYWNLDRKLKEWETEAGNVISATGAIYAIRRSLFRTVPVGVTDDFATSTSVIAQGYRLVFAPEAIAYEPVAKSSGVEFGRKARIMTRGLYGVLVMRELLNPLRHGFYAFQLFWHKFLRRLMVIPLLVLLLVSPLLWRHGFLYQAATLLQFGFYSCALLGVLLSRTPLGRLKVFALPFFFCLVNAASLVALINLLRGQRITFWEPQRQAAATGAAPETVPVSSKRSR